MTFRDVVEIRSATEADVGKDGKWMVYTLITPDWRAGQAYTDIYLVSVEQGVSLARQLTFTKSKNERSPRWSADGRFIFFLSDRDAPTAAATQRQLYIIRPDGGEARKLTETRDGVTSFELSGDGRWLAFLAGREEERQVWLLDVGKIETAQPVQIKHETPVTSIEFSPGSKRLYAVARDSANKDNRTRMEKKFTARIRNEVQPLSHLWAIDLNTEIREPKRITSGDQYSVAGISLSKDGRFIAFRGDAPDRYKRNVTEAPSYSDLYILETASNRVQRLTQNNDIGESNPAFSPDSRWMVFAASDDFGFFRNTRVYLGAAGSGPDSLRKLGSDFDGDVRADFWSRDGKTIYFNAGLGATRQLMSLSLESGKVMPVSELKGSLRVTEDEDSGVLLLAYSDPVSPTDYYTTAAVDDIAHRSKWRRLTDANPQVRAMALGETEAIQWKSTDGRTIEGVLTKPIGYESGKRYPLIVNIHGGPAGADVLSFYASDGDYQHVFATAGYATLQPNYRGSVNYGERHKMETSGDYFRLGFDDIMTGVDHLIKTGLADPDKLGAMGWSAGGHYSNWILTHTNRFKAISSGAGAVNWLSMYAQSDVQRNREFYFGGIPYDRPEALWDMSPLKYIKNARTPTLIHCVDGDPRVPRPQSDELHMALKKLGVPTEYIVYPGNTHGIPDMRNKMVKMVSEFAWFEKYIRGKDKWFEWGDVLATLPGN